MLSSRLEHASHFCQCASGNDSTASIMAATFGSGEAYCSTVSSDAYQKPSSRRATCSAKRPCCCSAPTSSRMSLPEMRSRSVLMYMLVRNRPLTLVAQRRQWIQPRGAAGGNDGRKQCNRDQDHCHTADDDRIQRADSIEQPCDRPRDGECADEADAEARDDDSG